MTDSTFRNYFTAELAYPALSDREKAFIGLAVTMSRGCEP